MVSIYRLQVMESRVRRRIVQIAEDFCRFARMFAKAVSGFRGTLEGIGINVAERYVEYVLQGLADCVQCTPSPLVIEKVHDQD